MEGKTKFARWKTRASGELLGDICAGDRMEHHQAVPGVDASKRMVHKTGGVRSSISAGGYRVPDSHGNTARFQIRRVKKNALSCIEEEPLWS